jgi:outer membrane protein assembly factor BamB
MHKNPFMGEKMDNTRKNLKIAVAILAIWIALSATVLIGKSIIIDKSIQATPLSTAKDYGDLKQYEWTTGGANENQSDFSAGPGPEKPDILWKTATSGGGTVCVFEGKAFTVAGGGFTGGGSTLYAFNAFTGEFEWSASCLGGAASSGGITKIDEDYLFVDVSGPEVHKISDGSFVSNFTVPDYMGHPGSAQYFPGSYSSTLRLKFVLSFNMTEKIGLVNAISLADPVHPELAWTYTVSDVSEIQGYGNGRLYVGTTAGYIYTLNATTGEFLWKAPKSGVVQQHGLYYDGNFYHAAASQCVTCWDEETGAVQWEYDASQLGERAYFAYRGAAGYGRYYDCAIPNDPHGWVACWDAKTGDLLWKQPAYYNIAYNIVALGGGKVYASKCDQTAEAVTAGLVMPGYSFSCFDAYTGTELWTLEGFNVAQPSVAYGNVYFYRSGYLYCIGSNAAKDWPFGFVGNNEQTRVAIGQSGPSDLSSPRWVFQTGAKISSSAAVANGKVYVGSEDYNWYCLDAYTGELIWNFTTGYKVRASAAVVDGKVFTGADDGNFYCLDADTGEELWKVSGGGLFDEILMPQELQSRSSPIVVGDKVYAGALDGNVYCLLTSNGHQVWKHPTEGPIGGSPVYYDGVIYIASTDTYLYALDANTGAEIWHTIALNLGVGYGTSWPTQYFCTGTPVATDDIVYVPGGVTYGVTTVPPFYGGAFGGGLKIAAFNRTTGDLIYSQDICGNSGGVWVPTYFDGQLYIPENMRLSSMNASDPAAGDAHPVGFFNQDAGNRTWTSWIGYQVLSSAAYADDISGAKVYIGSDVGSISCFDAETGAAISAYQTGANVEASPTIWEGKLYIGGMDRNIYCFDDSPVVDMTINAAADKGAAMWNNETINIAGQLISNPNQMLYQWNIVDGELEGGSYVPVESDMHPGVPNAEIKLSLTTPGGEDVPLTTTTDNSGKFSFSYDPTEVGDWGWVIYYDGQRTTGLEYSSAYGEWNAFTVASPTASGQTEPEPEPNALPMEAIYLAIAVIIIVVVALGVYIFLKGKK